MNRLGSALAIMALWLPFAVFAQAPTQNPNTDARKLAERLGQERNIEGLRTILESRNVDLVRAYDGGMRHGAVSPKMSPAMEALLVQYYDDPVVGGASRVLSTWDRPQTRAYCDKLVAEWKGGRVRPSTYPMRDSALKCDAPGVEASLREWIAASHPPEPEDLRQIISYLGRRHDVDAVPVLAKMDFGPQLENASVIVGALLDIGTPASGEAALARLAELRRMDGARADEARRYPLQRLASEPDKAPIGYAAFRKYEPEAARASAAAWLARRKDRDALEDTLALLSAMPPRHDAVQALVATNDIATWRRAREEVERLHREGAWDDNRYRFAAGELDRKLADPAAHFAQQAAQQRYQDYQQAMAPVQKARSDLAAIRATDPAGWFDTIRKLVFRQEAIARENGIDARTLHGGVAGDLSQQFLQLGDFARFRLKRPSDAIPLYEAAERWGLALGALAAGDTMQWDLRDLTAALAIYRRLAADLRGKANTPQGRADAALNDALLHWTDAQVAWLANRRPFRGTIDEADLSIAALVAFFGGARGDGGPAGPTLPPQDRQALARELAAMPASGAAFVATALATQYLRSAHAIREHVARMDPAGFSTAAFFVLVQHLDPVRQPEGMRIFPALVEDRSPGQPLRVAAREFLRERGIVDRVPDRPLR